jgi:hypothetical protein
MDFFDSIDKILPILFFFIWIFFGVFFKGKKRQSPSGTTPGRSKPPAGGLGDLRRTLRKVFEEIQAPVVSPEVEATSLEGTREDASVSEDRPGVVPVPEKNNSVIEMKQNAALALPVKSEKTMITIDTVRQGIIWSEILAPPVSMRD